MEGYDINQRARELTIEILRDCGYTEDRIARILDEKAFKNGDAKSVMYAGAAKQLKGEAQAFSITK